MKFHRATLAFAFTALTGLCLASTHAAPTATIQKVSTAGFPTHYVSSYSGKGEWGSLEARVAEVRLEGPDGSERRQFLAGEPLRLHVRVASERPLPAHDNWQKAWRFA